jgi:thymidylate synthase (FAD)
MERGREIKVLDNGYVRLVDCLGTDESIVEAARISTGRGFVSWEAYKRCKTCDIIDVDLKSNPLLCEEHAGWEMFPRGDHGILEYLYKMGHTTPFEMCEIVIDVQVPMDHWRQWIRNRTASVNEYSTRYSEAIDIMAKTLPGEWRTQGTTNRQGSGGRVDEVTGSLLSAREQQLHELARDVYEDRLKAGVAKEQARKDLPLSTYTAARWKIDLHNLLHNFLGKRMHPHAQKEIREYACAVAEIVKTIWPRSYALYEEYTLHGVHLSRTEKTALAELLHKGYSDKLGNEAGVKALLKKLAGE